MNQFYPAAQVDLLLKTASEAMHGLTEVVDGLTAENTLLKQAATNKVSLEKVAASTDTVDKFVSMLVDRAIISESSREKFANACLQDGDAALSIAMQALKSSESPLTQGRGIKTATIKQSLDQELEEEREAWRKVIDGVN